MKMTKVILSILAGLNSYAVWAANDSCLINDTYAIKRYGNNALAGDKNAQYDLAQYLISQGSYNNNYQKIKVVS